MASCETRMDEDKDPSKYGNHAIVTVMVWIYDLDICKKYACLKHPSVHRLYSVTS